MNGVTDEDEPLFLSLVTDLFPNQVLEKTSYPELEEAIASQVEAEGLIYHSPWVLKLIQVHCVTLIVEVCRIVVTTIIFVLVI